MLIHLHSQATTTPKIRAAIQASAEPAPVVAERFGITEQTVYKWRKRDSVEDRSHTPHRLAVPPEVAVRDGAMGFWKALDEVFPETRHPKGAGCTIPPTS